MEQTPNALNKSHAPLSKDTEASLNEACLSEGGEKDMKLIHKLILGCVAAASLAVASPAQAGDYGCHHGYWHHHCHHHHHHCR